MTCANILSFTACAADIPLHPSCVGGAWRLVVDSKVVLFAQKSGTFLIVIWYVPFTFIPVCWHKTTASCSGFQILMLTFAVG